MSHRIIAAVAALALGGAAPAAAAPALPFDEQTLDRIEELNRAISEHYEELEASATELEARRAIAKEQLDAVEEDLAAIERESADVRRAPERERAMRAIEEHRIDAKSRYLEILSEKHAIDVEAVRSFEVHASAILVNLERLAGELERSGRVSEGSERATENAFASLQRGTAIALSVLEEWGTLTRSDPRFRALWATGRVLNRNAQRLRAGDGVRVTVDLVRERTFVVRSLIDQARAMQAALDQQGLLLQVAAQNQMLRLHFVRLGAINDLELPDLDLEDATRRILEHIEEEPFAVTEAAAGDGLAGFEDCLNFGVCN